MTALRFDSGSEALAHLRAADPVFARILDAVGPYELELRADRFEALARSIVSQQLSVSAARTIWGRFAARAGAVTPEAVLAIDHDDLRACGLSGAKATYVHDLARRVLDCELDLERLDALSDEDVIRELTGVKGIGRWTAEMFLIFSLGRPDVLALDDVGLQRAAARAYALEGTVARDDLARLGEMWRPHRTAASLYLWASLDNGAF